MESEACHLFWREFKSLFLQLEFPMFFSDFAVEEYESRD